MKKWFVVLMINAAAFAAFAGGGQQGSGRSGGTATPPPPQSGETVAINSAVLAELGLEQVNGMYRFKTKRSITVEVYDRGLDNGRSKPEDNYYTTWIHDGMLRDHNIDVTFVPIPRWTEVDDMNNRLAAGTAPDVCVTYDYQTIQSYAEMGGITDINPYVNTYKDLFPNLWGWLGSEFINYNQDPKTNQLWAIEGKMSNPAGKNTFIREDWLKKLGLPIPGTLEEFHKTLIAFRDNARTLLGNDANMMVPFSTSYDVGWRAWQIISAFIPSNTTDKDYFIYGFDDRNLTRPSIITGEPAGKSGARILNQWYNEGLLWEDFPLYGSGDPTEDNLIKAGYVGAYTQNWDMPYRNADGITISLHQLVGPDANFIAIAPFLNDAGQSLVHTGPLVDRKVFLPNTNKEPIASLLYIDWVSKQENITYLQFGDEGITHKTMNDGAIQTITTTGNKIMNSPNNIDYTLTVNGIKLATEELTVKSMALGYADIDVSYIEKAYNLSCEYRRVYGHANVGAITAEEGLGQVLSGKRDALYAQSITAPVARFDAVWDAGYRDYLNSGGQAIIDERARKWTQFYGNKTSVE
jgi:putative aldouronate transport system substrate-binding protein